MTTLETRLARLEAARRVERDALAWPAWLTRWRAGADTFDFAGGAAWCAMAAERERLAIETLELYENT